MAVVDNMNLTPRIQIANTRRGRPNHSPTSSFFAMPISRSLPQSSFVYPRATSPRRFRLEKPNLGSTYGLPANNDIGESKQEISHVILKFGGTSVAKYLPTIVDTITPSLRDQTQVPVLVCSAQSYTVKEEGTTQCLLAAIDAALAPAYPKLSLGITAIKPITPPPTPPQGSSPPKLPLPLSGYSSQPHTTARAIISQVLGRHLSGARKVILDHHHASSLNARHAIMEDLEKDLRGDCERVVKSLQAVETLGEITPRIRDAVISVGELMACRTVVAAFRSRSIPAVLVNLTDLDLKPLSSGGPRSSHDNQHSSKMDKAFFDRLVSTIRERLLAFSLDDSDERPVLVVTGFFGPLPGSLLDTIGRGYTDVCAALCARALDASELQIWKEVDGVFSADPRKIIKAKLLPEISRNHAKLLTSYGSEVVHHLAIDQATHLNIPIVVKNVVKPASPGTRIVATPSPSEEYHARDASADKPDQYTFPAKSTSPTFAVTLLNDLEMVHVHFDEWGLPSQTHPISRVMDVLREHMVDGSFDLGLDLVNTAQGDICFMIKGRNSRSAKYEAGLQKVIQTLECDATVTSSPGMSYLQVVFMTPHRPHAVAAKTFGALADAKIDIKMISHGPMEYGVGCIISIADAMRAAAVVHDALLMLA